MLRSAPQDAAPEPEGHRRRGRGVRGAGHRPDPPRRNGERGRMGRAGAGAGRSQGWLSEVAKLECQLRILYPGAVILTHTGRASCLDRVSQYVSILDVAVHFT